MTKNLRKYMYFQRKGYTYRSGPRKTFWGSHPAELKFSRIFKSHNF